MPLGLALPGNQFEFRQENLAQVATERAAEAELAGRTIQIRLEVAQIIAIAIRHFTGERAQVHIRLGNQRVEVVPGELQPVDFGLGTQPFVPVHLPGQLQVLLRAGRQIQCCDLRALGIHTPFEQQAHGGVFSRQYGAAVQLVAVFEVTFGREQQLIELQSVRQVGAGLERLGGDFQLCRKVVRQRLKLTRQMRIDVTAGIGHKVQCGAQIALNLERHRQGFVTRRGQADIALQGERPVAIGLKQPGQLHAQVFALDTHRVDLQALGGPLRRHLQALELLDAVEQHIANLHHPDFNRQRQLQVRQADRTTAAVFARGQLQADLIGLQLIDAQGHARQAPG